MHPGVTVFVLVSLMTLRVCNGQATGLPLETCSSMVLDHDTPPQMTLAPYRFNFSDGCFKTALRLQVSLTGVNGSVFSGFFVQARKPNDDTFSYGTFSSEGDSNIATIDCFNRSASAIGHNNQTGYNFTIATFEWTAPADVSNDVIEFVASVVFDKKTYWTGVKTPKARCNDNIDSSLLPGNSETSSAFTVATASTTLTTETPLTATAATAIDNFTLATDGTGYTLSTVATTVTSNNESDTVAITTASMTNQTTSGAGRPKDSIMSLAFSVAVVFSLASVHPLAYL